MTAILYAEARVAAVLGLSVAEQRAMTEPAWRTFVRQADRISAEQQRDMAYAATFPVISARGRQQWESAWRQAIDAAAGRVASSFADMKRDLKRWFQTWLGPGFRE